MSKKPIAGTPIKAEEASKYLKKYLEVKKNLKKEVIPLKKVKTISLPEMNELNTFHNSRVNAFVFSKELIERFFSGKDDQGKEIPKAEYLMIILSAKYRKPDTIGMPTIVVAGVNKKDSEDRYVSLDVPYAADQQPPTTSIVEFPATGAAPIEINVEL
jgi:hypothetical protein